MSQVNVILGDSKVAEARQKFVSYPDGSATKAMRDKYKDTLRSLGVGVFGSVFLFEDRETPGSFVSVKIVDKEKLSET